MIPCALLWLALTALLTVLLPAPREDAFAPLEARTRSWFRASEPGVIPARLPSWTAALAAPSVLLLEALYLGTPARPSRSVWFDAHRPWVQRTARVLTASWAALAVIASSVLVYLLAPSSQARGAAFLSAGLAMSGPGSASSALAGGGAEVGAALLSLLALVLIREPARGRPAAAAGVVLGLLLAYAGYLWLVVVGAGVLLALTVRRPSFMIGTLVLAGALGVVLVPERLLDPGAMLAAFDTEWRRAGGAAVHSSSPDLSRLGTLASGLGGPFVTTSICLSWGLLRGRQPVLVAFWGFVLAATYLLPALGGASASGALQLASGPFTAALAISGAAWWIESLPWPRIPRRMLLVSVAAGLAALLLPNRVHLEAAVRASESRLTIVRAQLSQWIAKDDLWLSDRPLSAGAPLPGIGFVLPRDSRDPDRFDFAYWPRWYSEFRYVFVSAAQIRANLARDGAVLPRDLYRALEHEGTLVQEWGGGNDGYRLYRLPNTGRWATPLRDHEFVALAGGSEVTGFLSQLGGRLADAHRHAGAAAVLRAGLHVNPESSALRNNLGLVYLDSGEAREAAALFDSALRNDPRSAELNYNAARAYFALNATARAEQCLRLALTVRPDWAPLHYELARIFVSTEKPELARRALERYASLSGKGAADIERELLQIAPRDSMGQLRDGTP